MFSSAGCRGWSSGNRSVHASCSASTRSASGRRLSTRRSLSSCEWPPGWRPRRLESSAFNGAPGVVNHDRGSLRDAQGRRHGAGGGREEAGARAHRSRAGWHALWRRCHRRRLLYHGVQRQSSPRRGCTASEPPGPAVTEPVTHPLHPHATSRAIAHPGRADLTFAGRPGDRTACYCGCWLGIDVMSWGS